MSEAEFRLSNLSIVLDVERNALAKSLAGNLSSLEREIATAKTALAAGDRLPAHLIANAAMITADIARWNLTLELLPRAEKEEP